MIETHERGAGVARGVEGLPGLAGAVAADLYAARIPTQRQDQINTVIVPLSTICIAAVGIAGTRAVTDGVDAGVTNRIQAVT
jgi:hypothetical protein